MRILKYIALIVLAALVWTAFMAYGFTDGFLLKPITSEDSPTAFIEVVKKKIKEEYVGNIAMVLIEDGKVSKDYFYGIEEEVNENTVFPVASISKWLTSFGILKLVEQGKLDLDRPVDDYLTRWHLPESEFDNKKVTIRRLLSHSSGLVDDLGYSGFGPDEKVQTLEESLTKAADSPYSEGVARVGYEPGSKYMYSGAGYTLLQLVIEEVTGLSFQDYMRTTVFEPLGMHQSTFIIEEKPNLQLAHLYNRDGSTPARDRFTALAAAGLNTCTADMAKFLIANVSKNPVLKEETIIEMSKPQIFIGDVGVYGLGPHLYSQPILNNEEAENSTIIGHDGSGGSPAINTAARIDLQSKNGIIILEMGSPNLASSMGDEWLFWKAGIADYVVMQRNIPYLLKVLIIGYILIVAVSIFIIRKTNAS
jgi:CubicO group peptidase (beta-lactamase class C family)